MSHQSHSVVSWGKTLNQLIVMVEDRNSPKHDYIVDREVKD